VFIYWLDFSEFPSINQPRERLMVRSLPGKPFLNKLDIQRFKAKFRFWPPPDASPVIAIEPWGKQFFVYNGIKNVEIRGDSRAPDWGTTRPKWWREDIALSLLKPGEDPNQVLSGESIPEEGLNYFQNQTQTHLCVTDFRKRPLMYLTRDELRVIRENLKNVEQEMEKLGTKLVKNEAVELEKLNSMLEDDKYMHIRRGRIMNPPSRTGRGVMSTPNRPPKTKPR
jgi:hypothetical protein